VPSQTAARWFTDLRHQTATPAPNSPLPFPIGANRIAHQDGSVFVNNTEKALVIEIPVMPNGMAGTPSVPAQVTGVDPDFGPPGLDGMALDVRGNIYVPVINHSRIVKIASDGSSIEDVATLADGLGFPASLASWTGKGERRSLFATNYSLGPPIFAGPGLVKLTMEDPGMPLP
jgi:sugar lactone lactonase YvrE